MNKNGTQRLETERLILRRYVIEDAEDMFRNWASDPEVTKFLTWPTHKSVEITKMVLNDWLPQYADGGYFNWALEYKENAVSLSLPQRAQVFAFSGLGRPQTQSHKLPCRSGYPMASSPATWRSLDKARLLGRALVWYSTRLLRLRAFSP